MNVNTPIEKIRQILKEQNGLLLTSDLAEHNIARTYLTILQQNGEIEQIQRGAYARTGTIVDELFLLQKIYKRSVFSHETALYLHDLSDRSPLFYTVSVPKKYHSAKLNKSGHKIFYYPLKLFELGLITLPSEHGNMIRVTDLERTICDILRNRNQIDDQLLIDGIKRYVQKKNKRLDILHQYAQKLRVHNILTPYLELLL